MPFAPVNPSASPAAEARLSLLGQISGRFTLSGQHNPPRELSAYSDEAAEIAGAYPAVWGQDFGFAADGDMDGVNFRPSVIEGALAQHAAGSVVTLMWHAVRPTQDEPVTFDGSICAGRLADHDWDDLLSEGTATRRRWEAQVDVIAGYLAQLRDADVPVLWRPYHEMNGSWFWWGGRPGPHGYAALYRQLFDRLTHEHGLDNLIWVWNANAPRNDPGDDAAAYADFYPGHDVVDVLAADVYGNDYARSHHDDLLALAQGRPIALGEVGVLPTPTTLEAQPGWAWFMTWTGFLTRENRPEAVQALYAAARVLNREDLHQHLGD